MNNIQTVLHAFTGCPIAEVRKEMEGWRETSVEMSQELLQLKPSIAVAPVLQMPWSQAAAVLAGLGIEPMVQPQDMPDVDVYYTTEKQWKMLIPSLAYPADKYIASQTDCDDYSKKASADSSWHFGLNCIQAWGDTPYGYHAFNLVFISGIEVRIFEPNAGFECAGELMRLDNDYGWTPRRWKP